MSNTFLYFAYGSNLLSKRIHINNPSAVRCGIGKLEVSLFKINILITNVWLEFSFRFRDVLN